MTWPHCEANGILISKLFPPCPLSSRVFRDSVLVRSCSDRRSISPVPPSAKCNSAPPLSLSFSILNTALLSPVPPSGLCPFLLFFFLSKLSLCCILVVTALTSFELSTCAFKAGILPQGGAVLRADLEMIDMARGIPFFLLSPSPSSIFEDHPACEVHIPERPVRFNFSPPWFCPPFIFDSRRRLSCFLFP